MYDDAGGGGGDGICCCCHICRQICLSLAHIFLLTQTKTPSKWKKKKIMHSVHLISLNLVICTRIYSVWCEVHSFLDFLSNWFYCILFYVCFNSMPVSYLILLSLWREKITKKTYLLAVDAAGASSHKVDSEKNIYLFRKEIRACIFRKDAKYENITQRDAMQDEGKGANILISTWKFDNTIFNGSFELGPFFRFVSSSVYIRTHTNSYTYSHLVCEMPVNSHHTICVYGF